MIRIGDYNGIPLLVPRKRMYEVIGRVAYFREFGNMLVFIGGGEACRDDVVNCPVHPCWPRLREME